MKFEVGKRYKYVEPFCSIEIQVISIGKKMLTYAPVYNGTVSKERKRAEIRRGYMESILINDGISDFLAKTLRANMVKE